MINIITILRRFAGRRTYTGIACQIFIILSALALTSPPSFAILFEDMAICAKAMSLANAVTADPPGHMSLHYNPAGLSSMHDGTLISFGVMSGGIEMNSRFSADPDYPGLLGGVSADINGDGKDEFNFNNEDDPLNGTESEVSGLHLYIPTVGDVDMAGGVNVDTPFGFGLSAVPGVPIALSHRKPGSRWTFAVGAYAPGAGGYYREDDDPGRYMGRAVALQHIVYAAPALSYQLTDSLSAGFTIAMAENALSLDMDMRLPNDLVALTKMLGEMTKDLYIPIISDLTLPSPWFGGGLSPYDRIANVEMQGRDDYCPSYNLGLLWQPANWFALGACYQSEAPVETKGKYKFTYSKEFQNTVNWMGSSPLLQLISTIFDLPMQGVPEQTGNFYLEGGDLPQRAHIGVMLRPFKRLKLTCDAHWCDYSRQDVWKIHFDQDIQPLKIAKFIGHQDGPRTLSMRMNFEDETHLSYGMEYQLLNWLSLRAGYEDRKTSVNRDFFSVLAPLPDLDVYGAGLCFNFKSGVSIDLAYTYMESETWRVPNNTSKLMNSTSLVDAVYNPYAGLDVEGEMEASFVTANFTMPYKYIYRVGNVLRDYYKKVKKQNPFQNLF